MQAFMSELHRFETRHLLLGRQCARLSRGYKPTSRIFAEAPLRNNRQVTASDTILREYLPCVPAFAYYRAS